MGIRSHIRVQLSRAALVESAALAGLRTDLNAIDTSTLQGIYGAGVSLDLSPAADWTISPEEKPLTLVEGLSGESIAEIDAIESAASIPGFDDAPPLELSSLGAWSCLALQEYSNEELLLASDTLFALLDNPGAFGGSDMLSRYEEIGREITRRQQDGTGPLPATEGQAAS
jgi:hypothetical protein